MIDYLPYLFAFFVYCIAPFVQILVPMVLRGLSSNGPKTDEEIDAWAEQVRAVHRRWLRRYHPRLQWLMLQPAGIGTAWAVPVLWLIWPTWIPSLDETLKRTHRKWSWARYHRQR